MSEEGVSIRAYVETLFAAHAREHELLKDAINKAESLMSVRLENMNEFRAQLDRQAGTLATKELVESRLISLQRFQDKFWGVVLALTMLNGLITALIVMLLRKANQ